MKPFNLEAAKAGAPVQTRCGEKARIICFDRKRDFPIVALIGDGEFVECRAVDGACYSDGRENSRDLVMAPTKREGWINVYSNNCRGYIYPDEKTAKKNIDILNQTNLVATAKIEWEE